jgi:prevent-host-death family protein
MAITRFCVSRSKLPESQGAGEDEILSRSCQLFLDSVYNSQNDQTITDGKKMKTWQLQHAKNHLSEVVRNANNEGPQAITLHGKPSAVVISFDEYNKAINVRKPDEPLSSFFHNSPLRNSGIELKRSK